MIGQSIEVEEHPDYKKGDDGIHWPENGHNDGILMHRFVGGIIVEGKVCRVQTVMKEYLQANMSAREYAYDVAKIEVLDDMPNTSNGVAEATEGLQPLANIIQKFEKSYDPGKSILSESAKADNNVEEQSKPEFYTPDDLKQLKQNFFFPF